MLYRLSLIPVVFTLSCAAGSGSSAVDASPPADASATGTADAEATEFDADVAPIADAGITPTADADVTADAAIPPTDAAVVTDAAVATDAEIVVPDATPPVLGDALLITEIVDATLSGGLPKFIELTNHSDASVDMTGFSVGVYSNGSSTLADNQSIVLSGSLAAGESYIISFENGDSTGSGRFQQVYGVDPDNFDFGSQINGDDVVALFAADGNGTDGAATGNGADATLIDVYGIIGDDGTGEPWEYTDGFASRNAASVTASATFNAADWTFSGAGNLSGQDAAGIAAVTNPGTH